MSLVGESRIWGGQARSIARLTSRSRSEYDFLLGRFIDEATLARACAIAQRWGVHPHEVMIANGWLEAEDYYRALAERCNAPYKAALPAREVTPPRASPRQCLAGGPLKERGRAGGFVFAPERLRPDALREMLARLSPYSFSLASPNAVRDAIGRHFGASFARHAIEGLASRPPDRSARERPTRWQGLGVLLGGIGLLLGMAFAPVETVWAVTLTIAILFVPVIAFRLLAAYGLYRTAAHGDRSPAPRVPEDQLPIYSVLVPLYREAHMLPSLVAALRRLDDPAASSTSSSSSRR